MKKQLHALFLFALFCFASSNKSEAQQIIDTTRIYGITIDDFSGIDTICDALRNHCKKMTVRIAIDEHLDISDYAEAIDSIHNVAFMMGEIFDSYFTDSFTLLQHTTKAEQYLAAYEDKVDIWEIGNEINGEWLGEPDSVRAKMASIYDLVKNHGKKTALTLFYNKVCFFDPQNEMFSWVANYVPDSIKQNVDYLLVSYYEDFCYNYQPDWQEVFDSLHTIFPNSKLGMGECGTLNEQTKDEFITRYYTMNITTPNYIGGYFWWYYKQDCIPYTTSHWNTLNNAICTTGINEYYTSTASTDNYPNPFCNSTEIRFRLERKEKINLTVYDCMGRIVQVLLNEEKNTGNHQIAFNASSLADGVYFYTLSTSSGSITKRMILSKIH